MREKGVARGRAPDPRGRAARREAPGPSPGVCWGRIQGHAWGRRDAGRAVGAPEGRGEPRGAPREVGPSGGTGTSPEGSRPRLTRRSPRLGCAGDAQGHAGGRRDAGRPVTTPARRVAGPPLRIVARLAVARHRNRAGRGPEVVPRRRRRVDASEAVRVEARVDPAERGGVGVRLHGPSDHQQLGQPDDDDLGRRAVVPVRRVACGAVPACVVRWWHEAL